MEPGPFLHRSQVAMRTWKKQQKERSLRKVKVQGKGYIFNFPKHIVDKIARYTRVAKLHELHQLRKCVGCMPNDFHINFVLNQFMCEDHKTTITQTEVAIRYLLNPDLA